MRNMVVPFSPPDISEIEINQVVEALRSGWITTGPRTKKLEKLIACYVGAEKCVCLSSQTACAEMALRLLQIGEGDEVIVPAYTYTASASVISHVGAKIVLVDAGDKDLRINIENVAKAITPNTKAIIPVDLGGVPCDYDKLFELAESKRSLFKPNGKIQESLGRIAIMADTAHALGASYKGRPIGSVADFSSFSFHAVKNFTTAEGGALTWRTIPGIDNEDIYKQLQLYSLHGQSKDAMAKTTAGAWEYDIVGTWFKCNMTDVAASIGLAQFERYPKMLERRNEIIKKYDDAFLPLGIKNLKHFANEYKSSGHLYITEIPGISTGARNKIITDMALKGVSCNVHYKPLPMHTAYKNLGFDIADFPNAYSHYEGEITLPLHTCLTDEQVDYVIECYKAALKDNI